MGAEEEQIDGTASSSLLSPSASATDAEHALRVHTALQATNRKLLAELTAARVAVGEKSREVEEKAERVRELEEAQAEMQALIAKLEEDILKVTHTQRGRTAISCGHSSYLEGSVKGE